MEIIPQLYTIKENLVKNVIGFAYEKINTIAARTEPIIT